MEARRDGVEGKVVEDLGIRPKGPDHIGLAGHSKTFGLHTMSNRKPLAGGEEEVK